MVGWGFGAQYQNRFTRRPVGTLGSFLLIVANETDGQPLTLNMAHGTIRPRAVIDFPTAGGVHVFPRFLIRRQRLLFSIYLGLTFALSFRASFPLLRNLALPVFIAPLATLLLLVWGIALWQPLRQRDLPLFLVILIGVVVVRMPLLRHLLGLFDSDDMIVALMARHFANGQSMAFYFYSQFYMGGSYA